MYIVMAALNVFTDVMVLFMPRSMIFEAAVAESPEGGSDLRVWRRIAVELRRAAVVLSMVLAAVHGRHHILCSPGVTHCHGDQSRSDAGSCDSFDVDQYRSEPHDHLW